MYNIYSRLLWSVGLYMNLERRTITTPKNNIPSMHYGDMAIVFLTVIHRTTVFNTDWSTPRCARFCVDKQEKPSDMSLPAVAAPWHAHSQCDHTCEVTSFPIRCVVIATSCSMIHQVRVVNLDFDQQSATVQTLVFGWSLTGAVDGERTNDNNVTGAY